MTAEEAITRVVNTAEKRIQRQFDITVKDTDTTQDETYPSHSHLTWHAKLNVKSTGNVDWYEVYEQIEDYEFLYNTNKYQASVDLGTNGAEGELHIKFEQV